MALSTFTQATILKSISNLTKEKEKIDGGITYLRTLLNAPKAKRDAAVKVEKKQPAPEMVPPAQAHKIDRRSAVSRARMNRVWVLSRRAEAAEAESFRLAAHQDGNSVDHHQGA